MGCNLPDRALEQAPHDWPPQRLCSCPRWSCARHCVPCACANDSWPCCGSCWPAECVKNVKKYTQKYGNRIVATYHGHAPDTVVDISGHIATSLTAIVAIRRVYIEFAHFTARIGGRNNAWNVGYNRKERERD